MKKIRTILVGMLVMLFASNAFAEQSYFSSTFLKDGHYVSLESWVVNPMYIATLNALEAAGWKLENGLLPYYEVDESCFCTVKIWDGFEINLECYTPHPGHGISVRDHVISIGKKSIDYNSIPEKIEQLRKEHEVASKALGIK